MLPYKQFLALTIKSHRFVNTIKGSRFVKTGFIKRRGVILEAGKNGGRSEIKIVINTPN